MSAVANAVRCRTTPISNSENPPRVGELVAVEAQSVEIVGTIRAISADNSGLGDGGGAEIEVELLGRVVPSDGGSPMFTRGVSVVPPIGSRVFPLDEGAVAAVLPPDAPGRVRVGSIDQLGGHPMSIEVDDLLATHFALFGATGSGKTSSVVTFLRAITDKMANAHVIVLDPHGEYQDSLGDRARVFDGRSLRLPYWLLRFHELSRVFKLLPESANASEIKILHDAVLESKRRFQSESAGHLEKRLSLDAPIPYRLSELRATIVDRMGELKRTEPVPAYQRVLNRLDELTHDERFAFMFSTGYLRDMLGEVIGQFLPSGDAEKSLAIIDLSDIPEDALDVIVACVARLLLSLSHWASSDGGIPTLLVCEEAGRYMSDAHEREGRIGHEALAQIAREGRKFGVSLAVVAQRPSQLSGEIVSQLGSVFVMRTGSAQDLDFIARALPDSAGALIDAIPSLSPGGAIAFGQAAPFPIRFRFDRLPEAVALRPKSAKFSQAWSSKGPDAGVVARAIQRWREHGHLFHR